MGFATEIADEEDEAGVVTNDAMRSIIAAVTRKPNTIGQIGVDIDVTPLKELVERFDKATESLEKIMNAAKPTPDPTPKPEGKGFFNF